MNPQLIYYESSIDIFSIIALLNNWIMHAGIFNEFFKRQTAVWNVCSRIKRYQNSERIIYFSDLPA